MIFKKQVLIKISLSLILAIGLLGLHSTPVHADNLSVNIGLADGSCNSIVNGSSSSSANVAAGSVTLTVQNIDAMVGQSISGPGVSSSVQRNSKNTNSTAVITLDSVTSKTVITFTPIPDDYTNPPTNNTAPCPVGSSVSSSTLILNPVSAPSPTPNTPSTNPSTANPDPDEPTTNDDKKDDKSNSKKSTNINLLPDEKTENAVPEKGSSNILVISIIAGTIIILAIIAYLIKIKKIKLGAFKDIRRKSK